MSYLSPNTQFSITGQNMNLIDDIKFGEIFVEDLEYVDVTGISGTVPINAFTSEVLASTSHGQFSLGQKYIILTSDDQVAVGTLPVVSGQAGNIFTVTGENFYQITNVKFGEKQASFNLVDSQTVEAVIPQDADYSGVTVFSSLRTGLNNNQSLASGLSVDEFIPIPETSGLNSFQLASGETLFVTGFSLSGVTGVRFAGNDSLISDVTLGSSSLSSIVPSGNIRGQADLLLPSGQFSRMSNNFTLSPLAQVTGAGYSPVGVSSEKPAGSTGTLLLISGDNLTSDILYQTGTNYLGTVMGKTGEFKLLSDKVASGMIPTGIKIEVSGGDAGTEPTVSSGIVSLFSDNYPESYSSDVYFTPTIGLPKISNISPSSGIVGDFVTIKGNDLYGMTGVNFLYQGGNVGIGSYVAGTLGETTPGFELSFEIGNAASLGSLGESYDVVLSGAFGAVTGTNGFFALGTPTVSSIDPNTEVVPGSTGLMVGTCLYSGTEVELWTGGATLGSYEFFNNLPASGYDTTNHDEIKFQYPSSFPSGVNFKVRPKNRRSLNAIADTDSNITVLTPSFLSGFEPLSGEYGDTITVSGHFENIRQSGLKIGNITASDINQTATTGFNFVIPQNTTTNTISIDTSGGFLQTTGFLLVSPAKPSISGYFSGFVEPANIDYSQVFKPNDSITISGAGMDIVSGIRLSGTSGYFDFSNFTEQTYRNLSFKVPVSINGESGQFELLDTFGRTTQSNSTGINLISVSGISNYLSPADTLNISGFNITGMDVLFNTPTGGYITVSPFSNTLIGDGLERVQAQVPTGITHGSLRLTGRNNVLDAPDNFYPLSLITGISGLTNNNGLETTPDTLISITGINSFDAALETGAAPYSGSGVALIGFSGFNNSDFPDPQMSLMDTANFMNIPIEKYSTGVAVIGGVANTFYTQIDLRFTYDQLLSGNMFIIDPWWVNTIQSNPSFGWSGANNYTPGGGGDFYSSYSSFQYPNFFIRPSGETEGDYQAAQNINKKIEYYRSSYGEISVTGEGFYVTGFDALRPIQGSQFTLSGKNLNRVESIMLDSDYGGKTHFISDSSGDSSFLTFSLPMCEGPYSITLTSPSGKSSVAYHTGYSMSGTVRESTGDSILNYIDVVAMPQVNAHNVILSGASEPEAAPGYTQNYTAEETVNGTVFIVTRTKFPDGTTMVINSAPKP
jgi:hypothetical protein